MKTHGNQEKNLRIAGTVTINATAKDSGGNVATDESGTVNFLIGTSSIGSGTCTNGVASITYTQSVAGAYTITAWRNATVTDTVTVTFAAEALADMTVTATPATINVSEATDILINVTDTSTSAAIADGASVELEFGGSVIDSGTTVGGEYTAAGVTVAEAGTINVSVTKAGYKPGSDTVTVTVGEPTELIGDINGDDTVDYIDLGMLGASYGISVGDTGYNASADLSGDGIVNYIDLGMLGAHYGESA